MSAITIDNDLVHYEVLGRGRPVIFIHGWLSSWRYWVPTMQQLSMKYRTYALDLWGFGDTSKDSPARFGLDAQVKLVNEFMDSLGINKAAFVGHSLGAAVAARLALNHPDRVARLLAVSPPLFGAHDNVPAPPRPPSLPEAPPPPPAAPADATDAANTALDTTPDPVAASDTAAPAGAAPEAETVNNDNNHDSTYPRIISEGKTLRAELTYKPGESIPQLDDEMLSPMPDVSHTVEIKPQRNPLLGRIIGQTAAHLVEKHLEKSASDYDSLMTEVSKTHPEALDSSAQDFLHVDLSVEMRRMSCPAFVVHGEHDTLLPPPADSLINYLVYGKNDFRVEIWPQMNHFPMLMDPAAFQRLMMDFLGTKDLKEIQFEKISGERWVRKVR